MKVFFFFFGKMSETKTRETLLSHLSVDFTDGMVWKFTVLHINLLKSH